MSGPKDYQYTLSAARRMAIRARREAERYARQQMILARLEAQRERAKEAALRANAQRAQTLAKLRAQRTAAEQRKQEEVVRSTAMRPSVSDQERVSAVPTSIDAEVISDCQVKPTNATDQMNVETEEQATEEITVEITEVLQLRDALHSDEAVRQFRGEEATKWRLRADNIISGLESSIALKPIQMDARTLISDAKVILDTAGEIQEQFATRNELLSDMIASLQEVGFYVSDPYFERPKDPEGPVILKAVRGGETMTAAVDLTDTIRSVWDGTSGEHCKNEFFRYVDQMKNRGVEIEAIRPDLRDRPRLKQQGAKELPRGQDINERNK